MENLDDDVSFCLEALRKWGLLKCLERDDSNPLHEEKCEEDLFLETVEEEVMCDVIPQENSIKLDVNKDFPEKFKLEELLQAYQDVFGDIHRDGMDVPPMT